MDIGDLIAGTGNERLQIMLVWTELENSYLGHSAFEGNGLMQDFTFRLFGNNSITTFKINHNYLRSIEPQCFNYLEHVTELDLSHNLISEIQPGSFNKLRKLETISLCNNRLRTFSGTLVLHLPWLRSLYLSTNVIDNNSELEEFYDGELTVR